MDMPLLANLSAFFSRPCEVLLVLWSADRYVVTHLLHFFVLRRRLHDGRYVIGEAELLQSLGDVIAGYRLLGLLFGNLVCL